MKIASVREPSGRAIGFSVEHNGHKLYVRFIHEAMKFLEGRK